MCLSIEPMICSFGEFGVRLEDHAYISADGPHVGLPSLASRWITLLISSRKKASLLTKCFLTDYFGLIAAIASIICDSS